MTESAPPARILCRTGDFAGATFEVEGEAAIGRHTSNPVSLQSPLLSRQHARIWVQDGRWWLEDLGSRNGTKLDGADVREPVPLDSPSVITLADAIDVVFVHVAREEVGTGAPHGRTTDREERAPDASPPARQARRAPPEDEERRTLLDEGGFGALPDLAAAGSAPAGGEPREDHEEREESGTVLDGRGFGALPDLEAPSGEPRPEREAPAGTDDRPEPEREPGGPEPGLGEPEPEPGEPEPEPEHGPTRLDHDGFGPLPELGDAPTHHPPEEPRPTWALSIGVPGAGPLVFALEPGEAVLGRAPDCDVTIPDPEHLLSRRHATIRVDDDGATLTDLGSANGTWIDEERIDAARLGPGDTFRLGPKLELTLVRT